MVSREASPSHSRLSLNVDAGAAGDVPLFPCEMTLNPAGGGALLGKPQGPWGGSGWYGVVATVQMFIDYVSAAQVNKSRDS